MRFFVLLIATALAANKCNDINGDGTADDSFAACGDTKELKSDLDIECSTANGAAVDGTCDALSCCKDKATDNVDATNVADLLPSAADLAEGVCKEAVAADDSTDEAACKKDLEKAFKAAMKLIEDAAECAEDAGSDTDKLDICVGKAAYAAEKACEDGSSAAKKYFKDYKPPADCDTAVKALTDAQKKGYDEAKEADASPAFMVSGAIALIALLL